jgi:PAS domain S-box-containing protein
MEEIGYQLENSLQELQSKTAEAEAWRDQMRDIFDTSRDALFLLDEKGFFDCNPAAVQLFGFEKKEDIVGKTPFDVSPENQPNGETSENAAMARIREAIEKGSAFFEWTHKRKDGSIFPATVLLSAFSWFGKPVLQATVRDITEQKLQEYEIKQKNEELLASEEELRQNSEELQAVNDHLMKVKEDLENSLKELKETQASLVQSEKMAFLGQLVAGVAHEINTPLGAINASNSNSLRLLPSIVQNMLECGSRLNEEENKELQKILLQILDNTTILTSREERQYKKEVSEFLEGIGIFNNSNIASDLVKIGVYKNLNDYVPLLKKIQEVPLIMDILSAVGKMKINLTNTATAVQKTNKIIFALKNYSYKSQVEEAQPFDVVQNLQMILTLYHNQIKHGINLHTKFDENLPNVLGWSDELNQVWTNLITNSLQAMNFQGDLTIEAHQNNGHIEVKISDSGPGIPSEIQDKIFDPFFTTKKQGEGTGLGLGICKKIVEKHKGEISFKSQPGKTEFSVKLPIFNS